MRWNIEAFIGYLSSNDTPPPHFPPALAIEIIKDDDISRSPRANDLKSSSAHSRDGPLETESSKTPSAKTC